MNFDRVARSYQALEAIAFGRTLQRARVCWISRIPRPERVLIVGEGNGRFLCELLRIHPKIAVDCVDASKEMLDLAQARVRSTRPESLSQVCFLQQDILSWSPQNSYDLLVTHFVLDCFQGHEVKAIVHKLAQAATPNAAWLLADFTVPAEGIFARMHSKLWLRMMYSFFRLTAGIPAKDLVDATPYVQTNGFVRVSGRLSRARMVKSELFRRGSVAPLTERAQSDGCYLCRAKMRMPRSACHQ